jgi:hypothetical protein
MEGSHITIWHAQYLAGPCFGISVFCLCCLWLHTPRAGCLTSRWVLELACIIAIYYAQKAEISSQVASTFFFIFEVELPPFLFYVPSIVIGITKITNGIQNNEHKNSSFLRVLVAAVTFFTEPLPSNDMKIQTQGLIGGIPEARSRHGLRFHDNAPAHSSLLIQSSLAKQHSRGSSGSLLPRHGSV